MKKFPEAVPEIIRKRAQQPRFNKSVAGPDVEGPATRIARPRNPVTGQAVLMTEAYRDPCEVESEKYAPSGGTAHPTFIFIPDCGLN